MAVRGADLWGWRSHFVGGASLSISKSKADNK